MTNENLRLAAKEKMTDTHCIYTSFISREILCKIFAVLSYQINRKDEREVQGGGGGVGGKLVFNAVRFKNVDEHKLA